MLIDFINMVKGLEKAISIQPGIKKEHLQSFESGRKAERERIETAVLKENPMRAIGIDKILSIIRGGK